MRPHGSMAASEEKARLNDAFRLMRKAGLIAKQSFSCCGGCASCEIALLVAKMPDVKRRKVMGAVFYTRQHDLYDRRGNFVPLYISFGKVEYTDGETPWTSLAVGDTVTWALQEAGLDVEWPVNAEVSIIVHGVAKHILAARRLHNEAEAQ